MSSLCFACRRWMIHIMQVRLFYMHAIKLLALLSGISHYGNIVVITSPTECLIQLLRSCFSNWKPTWLWQPDIRRLCTPDQILSLQMLSLNTACTFIQSLSWMMYIHKDPCTTFHTIIGIYLEKQTRKPAMTIHANLRWNSAHQIIDLTYSCVISRWCISV